MKDNWMKRDSSRICDTCIFFIEKESKDSKKHITIGRCRRHAPVVGEGYPVVFPTDWCGDHKLDENKV